MSRNTANVKVRFAPSPTGYLHIGGARTALFNWLFARSNSGSMVLRIEDTDQQRSTSEDVERIIESLQWLGLDWDEGPFFQSQRWDIYREYAQRLIQDGYAYYSEEDRGSHKAVIFKIPHEKVIVDDIIHGSMEFDNSLIKDLVIFKSDGSPTYNFACVVDDALMGMTHIIRGDDHISNTPKQIPLYNALGFPVPKFAHVPLILGKDRTRLSKRHGATSVQSYQEEGFLSDALVNFLALLGWSPGDDRELFSRKELIQCFSLDRINRSNAVFDDEKLRWMNGEYIKKLPSDTFKMLVTPFMEKAVQNINSKNTTFSNVIRLMQERVRVLADLPAQTSYFFNDNYEYDEKAVDKRLAKSGVSDTLVLLVNEIAELSSFTNETAEQAVHNVSEKQKVSIGSVIHPCRVALTGVMAGPGLYDIMVTLGKEQTIARLRRTIDFLHKKGLFSAELA